MYRGEVGLDGSSRAAKIGLLFALKHSMYEDLTQLLPHGSLLLTAKDTCLPILEMNSEDLERHIAFREMTYGLGEFDKSSDPTDECTHIGQEFQDSQDSSSGLDESQTDMAMLLKIDIYLHLLQMFFPKQAPSPCCGPQQLQASLVKTIAYTNTQSSAVNQAVTSVPELYIDHTLGKMAANIIEYVNNQPSSNLSMLVVYGTNLLIYAVDWESSPAECVIFNVTDSKGPMKSSCMSPSAQYSRTVRVGGGGPLDSIRLDVWNVNETYGSFNFTGETYVSPRECVTVMETYTWKSKTEKVWGTIVLSDVRTTITDPATAFAVPSVCNGANQLHQTSDQLRSGFASVLSFAGAYL